MLFHDAEGRSLVVALGVGSASLGFQVNAMFISKRLGVSEAGLSERVVPRVGRFVRLRGAIVCLAIAGCGLHSTAMEKRQAEFAYSEQELVEMIANRLAKSGPRPASKISSRGEEVRRIEADRGDLGDRPDPNSLEAIVAEVSVKMRYSSMASEEKLVRVLELVSKDARLSTRQLETFEAELRKMLELE